MCRERITSFNKFIKLLHLLFIEDERSMISKRVSYYQFCLFRG